MDGKTSYSSVVTIISNCNGKTITIHPNPLTENTNLIVKIAGYNGNLKGELVDLYGKMIRTFNLSNGTNTLRIEGIAQATYMLRVTEESGGASKSFPIIVIK